MPDTAHSWTDSALVDACAVAPHRHAPGLVRWCGPVGSARHRHDADPTGSPTTHTGLEGSLPVGHTTPESASRPRRGSWSVTIPAPENAPEPNCRSVRLRRDGQPICAPNGWFAPTPLRSRLDSRPTRRRTASTRNCSSDIVGSSLDHTNEQANRNDVPAEPGLTKRNDVQTVATERCPCGSQLGSGRCGRRRSGGRRWDDS